MEVINLRKELVIDALKIQNFKGLESFDLVTDGADAAIHGANATGKTTIVDNYNWILFNKDSLDRSPSRMGIKTVDEDGNEIHHLEHTGEIEITLNGQSHTLKKIYKEVWTRRRNSPRQEITGHTNEFYIDDIPKKKKEFDEFVASIIDEQTFQLLTNPLHFHNGLDTSERKDILLSIAGDITDDKIVASEPELKLLMERKQDTAVDDFEKAVKKKLSHINKELDVVPTRINEAQRSIPKIEGVDGRRGIEGQLKQALEIKDSEKLKVNSIDKQIEAKREEIYNIKNGSKVNELKQEQSDIQLQMTQAKNDYEADGNQSLYKLQARVQEEESNARLLITKRAGLTQNNERFEGIIEDLNKENNKLRETYKSENAKNFDDDHISSCPTCKQDLPADQLDEARNNFNLNKSRLLEKINEDGKANNVVIEEYQEKIEKNNKQIESITKEISDKENLLTKLDKEIEELQGNAQAFEDTDDYKNLNKQIEQIHSEIEQIQNESVSAIEEVEQQMKVLQEQKDKHQAVVIQIDNAETIFNRINELLEQERTLTDEFEEQQHMLYLSELYVKTKSDLLEDKINAQFKITKFKMYDYQLNGGIDTNVCVATYDGVPYTEGLNNAARINVGLDIINTLSEHYGIRVPVFVDNAESVTDLLGIDSQVISLVVSKADEELRVEVEPKSEKEVA